MSDKRFENGYALLIGVGEHKTAPPLSLPVTVKDVQALQKTLLEPDLCAYPPENIQVLINQEANNSGVISGLSWLKEKAKADAQPTVVIYYSGHGWVSPTGDYYLITQDALPGAVSDTALRATAFTSMLRDIAADRVLIVLDCCHAEGMAEAKSLEGIDPELFKGLKQGDKAVRDVTAALAQGKGRAVFTSSLGNESSYFFPGNTMSVFTYHFVEALQGAGHRPGDTEVTIASLMDYVSSTVPKTVEETYRKDQHPFFKIESTNFPVALMRGDKGLPRDGWNAVKPSAERYLSQFTQQAALSGSGAINPGSGSIVADRGAVVVLGSNSGDLNTGMQITGDYVGGNKIGR
jgi:hypothetical protein